MTVLDMIEALRPIYGKTPVAFDEGNTRFHDCEVRYDPQRKKVSILATDPFAYGAMAGGTVPDVKWLIDELSEYPANAILLFIPQIEGGRSYDAIDLLQKDNSVILRFTAGPGKNEMTNTVIGEGHGTL